MMENLQKLVERLSHERRLDLRTPQTFSWGDVAQCTELLRELFCRVDRTVVRYCHLSEYDAVIEWMTNTQGRGLLLMGDCGRGKSVILTGVLPALLALKDRCAVPVHADELERPYPLAGSTAGYNARMTNLDYLIRSPFPIVDELGVEPMINDYGERYEGFNRIINAAERHLRPLFVSTNLSREQLLRRYGERTFDRLPRLCHVVEFQGASLR